MKKLFKITFTNAYGSTLTQIESATNEQELKEEFEKWMPEGELQKIEEVK